MKEKKFFHYKNYNKFINKNTIKNIVIASCNIGKIIELKEILRDININCKSILDYQFIPKINEDGNSFFENAFKKARIISEYTGEICLADDSGLCVSYLKGKPGIHSARYSGIHSTDEKNVNKLLLKLKNVPWNQRTASFICIIVLYFMKKKYFVFQAIWKGKIAFKPRGKFGFGYDSIFIGDMLKKTTAELLPMIKNQISHRAQALSKLKTFLKKIK